ncbi:hypothetical protein [Actinoplanes sp. NPDC049265]|uniref:hypothetical protein n=1 Tax=Actinoplanes sp. NPDC049265 TaxID=3363902 RepID=UPI00371A6909
MDSPHHSDQEDRLPDDHSAPRRPRPSAAMPAELLRDSRRRPLAEYLMPAAIIVAGILLVVAVGFVINSALSGKEPTALPAPPPPALGDIPPASDQAVIPLPSDPATPSKSATTTPPPARPSTTPPARKTRPPLDVAIARGAIPGRVDLSGEGGRDWVHWGQQGKFSLERAKDGDFQILEGAPTAPRFQQGRGKTLYSWRDGSPEATNGGTPVGINTCDKGNGFTLSVPAAKDDRTLRLYVGVQKAQGRLEAKLSAGGGTEVGTLEERGDGFGTAVFTITYRSAQGGKLNLSWNTAQTFGDGCGGVALQAATLR